MDGRWGSEGAIVFEGGFGLRCGGRGQAKSVVFLSCGREPSQIGMKNVDVVIAGRYRCVRLIGRGGFAEVYLAEDLRLANRRVALKVLVEHVADDPDRLQKFRQEAEIIGHLTSPYTVRAFDYGYDEQGRYYIAMEFVQGETLHELLRRQERLSIDRALEVAIQILDALEEAHQMGIIHRDLKPKNIMISPQRQGDMVKVLDFGVARILRQAEEQDEWTLVGTATYMAPEQAQGLPVSPASDLYSVGVVLYHMLAGRPPFLSQEDPVAVMIHHATKPVVSLRELRPELQIPEDVEQAVLKALEKQPQYRYQQAGAFRRALERALARYLEAHYGEPEGDSTLSTSITLKDVEEKLRAPEAEPQASRTPPRERGVMPSTLQSGEIRAQAALLDDLHRGNAPNVPQDPMASTLEGSFAQESAFQHVSAQGSQTTQNAGAEYIEQEDEDQSTQRLSGLQAAPEKTAVRKTPTDRPRQITDFDLLTPDFAAIEEIKVNEQGAGTRSGYYAASGDALPAAKPPVRVSAEKARTSPRQMAVSDLRGVSAKGGEYSDEDGDETSLSLQDVAARALAAKARSGKTTTNQPAWSEEQIGVEERDEMTFSEEESNLLEEAEELDEHGEDATLKPGMSSEDLIYGSKGANMRDSSLPTDRSDAFQSAPASAWGTGEEEGSTQVGPSVMEIAEAPISQTYPNSQHPPLFAAQHSAASGGPAQNNAMSGAFSPQNNAMSGAFSPQNNAMSGAFSPQNGPASGMYGTPPKQMPGAFSAQGSTKPTSVPPAFGEHRSGDQIRTMAPSGPPAGQQSPSAIFQPISSKTSAPPMYVSNGAVMGGAAASPPPSPIYPVQPTKAGYPPQESTNPLAPLPDTRMLPRNEVSPPRMPKSASPVQSLLSTGGESLRGERSENASTMELKTALMKRRWFGLIGAVVFLGGLTIFLISVGGESQKDIEKRQAQQIQAEYMRSLQEGDRAVATGRYRDALSSYKTALLHKAEDPVATQRMQQVVVDLEAMNALRIAQGWQKRKNYAMAHHVLQKIPQKSSLWEERNKAMNDLVPMYSASLRADILIAQRRRQWREASRVCVQLQQIAPQDRFLNRCRRVWRSYPPSR